jgi:hypothetical protein
VLSPSTLDRLSAGSSWTNAAVSRRNIGMSRHLLDGHYRSGQGDGELVAVAEGSGRGVRGNHRHDELLLQRCG